MPLLARLLAIAGRRANGFLADESAATAIEYALVAAGVGAAVAGTVWRLGSTMNSVFYGKIGSALN